MVYKQEKTTRDLDGPLHGHKINLNTIEKPLIKVVLSRNQIVHFA